MKQKIGLLTWHYYGNFGSALQAYALQETLKKMQYDVRIINYRDFHFNQKQTQYKNAIRLLLAKTFGKLQGRIGNRLRYPWLAFSHDYLAETKVVTTQAELERLSYIFDTIICGSDQIWAPNVFKPIYMLNFVDGERIKKISYAASIGLGYIPENLRLVYKGLLSDFACISVRENQGKELLSEKCGIEAAVVLDPTLLFDMHHYKKISKKISVTGKPFVFCYFLNKDHQYRKQVEVYAQAHKYTIIGCSTCDDSSWMSVLESIGPCEFIWLIEHAEVIFTDSYHGTIFSLLFHKLFWTFERFSKDDPICQNSRIYQLDRWFDIQQRIVQPDTVLSGCKLINYEEFDKRLILLRCESIRYLKGALD